MKRHTLPPDRSLSLRLRSVSPAARRPPGRRSVKLRRRRRSGARHSPQTGKVYTNKDLPASAQKPATANSVGRDASPTPTDPVAAATEQKAEDAKAPGDKPQGDQKDQAYWKNRMATAREELRRSEMFAEALQTRVNTLQQGLQQPRQSRPAVRHRRGSDGGAERADAREAGRRARQEADRRHRRRSTQGRCASRLGALTLSRVAAPAQILLVEDKDSLRTMLRHALERQGYAVLEARDQPEAVKHLQQGQPSVVLSDLRLPDGDGFGVLRASKEIDPDVPVIVMTAYGSIEDAVSAMKEGALDFLAKPVDPDHLLMMVARAIEQRRLVTENLLMKEELAVRRGAPLLVGEDASLRKVYSALQRASTTDATVLIEGESGTGKELFARSLHALSGRADAPFVAINCAAIPENLLETELFGYEKGAFTGAAARKLGKFEVAHRGTLVPRRDWRHADHAAGEDPARARREAFRARGRHGLGAGRRPAGRGHEPRAEGGRRRTALSRGPLLPPVGVPDCRPALRERPGDIPLLARFFVERFCRELKKKPLLLSRRRPSSSCRPTGGPATSVSCRTASSGR